MSRPVDGTGWSKNMILGVHIKGVRIQSMMYLVAIIAAILWINHLRKRLEICNNIVITCERYQDAHLQIAKIADEARVIARQRSVDFMRDGDPESANRNRLMADWFAAEADLARYKASTIRRDQTRVRWSVYMIFAAIPRVGSWSPVARSAGNPTLDKLVDHQSSRPLAAVLGPQPIPRATMRQPRNINDDKNEVMWLSTIRMELRDINNDKYESKLAYWRTLQAESGLRAPWFLRMEMVFVDLESHVMLKASAKSESERYRNLRNLEMEAFEKYGDLVHEAIWEDALHRAKGRGTEGED